MQQHHLRSVPPGLLEGPASIPSWSFLPSSFYVSHSSYSNLDFFTQPAVLSFWERMIDSQYIQCSFFARSHLVSSFPIPQH